MKKYIGIALAVLMVLGLATMAMSDSQVFKFKCTVQKYIEVNPAFATVSRSMTLPGHGPGNVPVRSVFGGTYDGAYANCPFSVSLAGHNAVDDNLPILARLEVNGNGYDRLQTIIQIRYYINLPSGPGWEGYDMDFLSDPEGANTGTWNNQSVSFTNTPHDGEIYIECQFGSSLPHLTPEFGVNNTWNQSADHGMYKCKVIATLTAL